MFVNSNKWTDDNSGLRGMSQKKQPDDGSQRQRDPGGKTHGSGGSHQHTNCSKQILTDNSFLKTTVFTLEQTRRFLAFYDTKNKSKVNKGSVLAYSTILQLKCGWGKPLWIVSVCYCHAWEKEALPPPIFSPNMFQKRLTVKCPVFDQIADVLHR